MPISAFLNVFMTLDRLQDRDLAAALGDMVVAWSAAEYALINAFMAITATEWSMATAAYYRMPTFETRMKVLLAMMPAWQTGGDCRDVLAAEMKALRRLAGTRNGWIHAYWTQQMADRTVSTFDMREQLPRKPRPVKASDVSNHVEAVQRHTQAIRETLAQWQSLKSRGS